MSTAPRPGEDGSMAVEVVFLIPVILMFTLLVAAGGRYVAARGDLDAAARDAARAASFARSESEAYAAIDTVLQAQLAQGRDCEPRQVAGDFAAGGTVVVRLHCAVSLSDLGLIGLSGELGVDAEARAPIDTYRRTG